MKKSIVFFILTIGWLIEGCYEDSWKITPIPGKWTGYLFPIRLN